jgi:hypothetical protein
LKFRRKFKGISNKHHNSGVNSVCGRLSAASKNNKEIKSMKKIFIGALLASVALAAPALAQTAVIVDEGKPATTPLRNDLKSNEAGVKGAIQPTQPGVVESMGVTTVAPATSSSTTVVVEPRSGASVTTGSSATVTTSALICADTRLSMKEQDDCATAMQAAANADEQLSIQKRYEARLSNTPLRNDLKSNDAGVKGAVQPATPRPN